MFGTLPAYGFYCRHVEDLSFKNIELDCEKPDARPSLVCDDVRNLDLGGWNGSTEARKESFRFVNVTRARPVSGLNAPGEANRSSAKKPASVVDKAG